MKRWIRDFGGYLLIVAVMSETDPVKAVETVIRRACYLLIPLSILFIKYFPFLGRDYDRWTGMPYYMGVTNNKNLLGVLCVISGLFFFWDLLKRWLVRKEINTRRIIFVNLVFISMTLWLMQQARSATSNLCLFIGCTIIALGHSLSVRRNPAMLKILIPLALSGYFILGFVIDIRQVIADLSGGM
jgi:exopolysaccharide production protein ExoQ